MKYTANKYHIWKHKATNTAIGKVVEIKDDDSIDNYVEVELPESFKKFLDVFMAIVAKNSNLNA